MENEVITCEALLPGANGQADQQVEGGPGSCSPRAALSSMAATWLHILTDMKETILKRNKIKSVVPQSH